MPYPLLLHAKHRGTDVTYETFGEWLVPWRFDAFEAEYEALRTACGLIDYSTQALIEVTGADRASFLHNLLTNDIKRLTAGTGCHAALLEANAKLIADVLVLADVDALWLLCDANRAKMVTQTLERYLFSEQVTLTNHERRFATLALQGPRTVALLVQLLGDEGPLHNPEDHITRSIQHVSLRIIRHTLTGEVGALCLCPAEHAQMVWEGFVRRGQPAGLQVVGWEALNTARIEAGIPWYGIDMDESTLLPETGLEVLAVSDTKGCYVGQEIVARMRTYGSANKKLMGLVINGHHLPVAGDRLMRAGEEAGWVTSACFSPSLQRPIGMGYVKRGAYDAGTPIEIEHGGTRLKATVAARPLVPPPLVSPANTGRTR